jgi:enoyl-CoA hydratase
MAFEHLILNDKGYCRIITINRPKVHNAINRRLLVELERALLEAEQNKSLRCLIITGAGEKSFVAGADISDMKGMSALEAQDFSQLGQGVFDLMAHGRLPVIAAVNGYALGGGLEMALACDFIYASENASFGLVETKLGLIPGFGGLGRLSHRVGVAMAKELIFAGAQINADEALKMGLVNKVVAEGEVVEHARNMAVKIAERGPFAVSLCKKLLRDADTASLQEMNSKERLGFGLAFASKDHQEGISAFLEKRSPNFEGL